MRRPRAPGGGGSPWAAALVLLVAGCGAAPDPVPAPVASPSTATPLAPAYVPADGLALRRFGYTSGPVDALSLPRSTVLVASVDQPDNVVAVLSAPSVGELAAYLRRALPAAGFTVTGQGSGATLTFTGRGWAGSVTGGDGTAAVLLRPG